MTLAAINAIWVGPRLGPVHAACLKSFLRHGHRVFLHVYEPPSDVPQGIELLDAGELLPQSRMFRHRKTGSLAPFVDLLRYELLRRGHGLYVDCDVYCLRPIEDADYIFGWQTDDSVNNAVLKLPPDCPVLARLCALKDTHPFLPPWQPAARRRKWRLQSLIGRATLAHLPFGTTGPDALTWYLREHELLSHAAHSDVFYPLAFFHAYRLFDPGLTIEDLTTHRTVALHLYNEVFHDRLDKPIPQGSPIATMLASTA
ncbi:hypothetical protein H0I76_10090 [Limibaculum sp. M0105]|uniref:Galactosyltransferase Lgt5 n=1 Tax=Thermohalobaculum xanthum TaxID=2753746 RepID=A0A8J7SCN4_9RHOB|nr:hypothetical protein [Thermohalobaculum xanthum]MBK0399542.1 hypothetical protein [Thermohalobaculum xanthum]